SGYDDGRLKLKYSPGIKYLFYGMDTVIVAKLVFLGLRETVMRESSHSKIYLLHMFHRLNKVNIFHIQRCLFAIARRIGHLPHFRT
ncbi:hypothetical protein, partial [Arcticibacter tournemirensis]|uniref:hypothetical protein n=1 Tax=Arcticibacter tournemirensis TaxID=699437 RepID=UPI001F1D81EB